MCLNLIPTFYWQDKLKYILAQQETLIVLAVMFFFSLNFLGFSFSSNKEQNATGEILLKSGEPGEVKVAIDAIKNLTQRAAESVMGVRESKVVINKQKGDIPIAIKLEIILGQGHSAPSVTESVVKSIDKAIFTALQLSGVPIRVTVKDITNAVVERKQRVV